MLPCFNSGYERSARFPPKADISLPPRRRRQDRQPRFLCAAPRAFKPRLSGIQRLRPANLGSFITVQRPGIAASSAFDPQPRSEANKIGRGAYVLGRHPAGVARQERFENR